MSIGSGTPRPAKVLSPKAPGPPTSFCHPCATMMIPTITRATSGAKSANRPIEDNERAFTIIPPEKVADTFIYIYEPKRREDYADAKSGPRN
jgi:hypothetical protein